MTSNIQAAQCWTARPPKCCKCTRPAAAAALLLAGPDAIPADANMGQRGVVGGEERVSWLGDRRLFDIATMKPPRCAAVWHRQRNIFFFFFLWRFGVVIHFTHMPLAYFCCRLF
mmetsp:Transcript_37337/g.63592  ORF Transcript_37337/g.63592 Transcript_37337/m.63592 type:complete len:114 (+) Transcript_37337:285-626(+)